MIEKYSEDKLFVLIYRWMYLVGAIVEPCWGIVQKYYSSVPAHEILPARFIVSAIVLFAGLCTFSDKIQTKYGRYLTLMVMISFNMQRAYLLYYNQDNWAYIIDCYTIVILSVIVSPTLKDLIIFIVTILLGSLMFPKYDYTLFVNNISIIPLISALKYAQFKLVDKVFRMQQQMKEQSILTGAKELIGSISHDINNNLQRIDNLAMIGQYKDTQSDVNACFSKIQDEVNKTSQVLLSFKGMIDTSEPRKESTWFQPMLSELLLIYKDKINNLAINFEGTSTDFNLYCDKKIIQNIMIHVIKNAMDELKNPKILNKKLIIICSEDESFNHIRISNNGDKIPENIKEKIFAPFFSTKEKGSGFGLGLSSAKELILRHGGDISLEEHNEFTTFCIKFPKKMKLAA